MKKYGFLVFCGIIFSTFMNGCSLNNSIYQTKTSLTIFPTRTEIPTKIPTLAHLIIPTEKQENEWQIFSQDNLPIEFSYPNNWMAYINSNHDVGQTTLITSDMNLQNQAKSTEIDIDPEQFYIWVERITTEKIADDLIDWVNHYSQPSDSISEINEENNNGQKSLIIKFVTSNEQSYESILFNTSSGMVSITGGPLEAEYNNYWETIIGSTQVKNSYIQTNTNFEISYLMSRWSSPAIDSTYGFTLPFEGQTNISCGPGVCPTHTDIKSATQAIDFTLKYGTPVFSTKAGTVIFAGVGIGVNSGCGNYVQIKHGDGFISTYEHLSKILVSKGQNIFLTTQIGEAGNSGYTVPRPTANNPYAGTHLHFQIVDSNGNGVPITSLVNITDHTAFGPSRASLFENNVNNSPTNNSSDQGPNNSSPSAKLIGVEYNSSGCGSSIWMKLTGFSPNSAITVTSSGSDLSCETGNWNNVNWTAVWGRTNSNGEAIIAYNVSSRAHYTWRFVDQTGSEAILKFDLP